MLLSLKKGKEHFFVHHKERLFHSQLCLATQELSCFSRRTAINQTKQWVLFSEGTTANRPYIKEKFSLVFLRCKPMPQGCTTTSCLTTVPEDGEQLLLYSKDGQILSLLQD